MAALVEVGVRVRVVLSKDPTTGAVVVKTQAESLTAEGETVRTVFLDVTDRMSAGRITGIEDLLGDIEARLKTIWEIE